MKQFGFKQKDSGKEKDPSCTATLSEQQGPQIAWQWETSHKLPQVKRGVYLWKESTAEHRLCLSCPYKHNLEARLKARQGLKVQVAQSCPTLGNPMECSPPGSSVHGILQARILEWVAMPSSRGSSPARDQTQVSCIAGIILYHLSHQGSPRQELVVSVNRKESRRERPSFSCAWDPLGWFLRSTVM